ncbi:MAG: glycoside hydrolase family 9 protein [Bacteroidales bacterium]|nr:glycoside hydrolase family 9 protein [Bacteroidales bacterium]
MKKTLIVVFSCIATLLFAQKESKYIVVDQFGYLPESQKIAIVRSPKIGYDANEQYTPGKKFAVIDAKTNKTIYKGCPVAWRNGEVDSSCGDQVWRFDFSEVKLEGTYYIKDLKTKEISYKFDISSNVYKEPLKHAFRYFYYQRAGFEKTAQFAGEGWTDKASHLGPSQDMNCREFLHKDDPSTEKDVHGGWYDAGDFNRYTNWTCDYIIYLLLSYEENPAAWTDDFNIPESGNGIPDIIDEVKFGLEHLLRLQFEDGSVVAVVGSQEATPPSACTKPSYWGGPSTSSALSAAAAYAYGAKIFAKYDKAFSEKLKTAAIKAWNWADDNPNVLFFNNSAEHGTQGLAAGQNECDDLTRVEKKLQAALRLYDATGNNKYKVFFELNYKKARMIDWILVFPFGEANQDMLLYYTAMDNANPDIVKHIKAVYARATDTIVNLFAIKADDDPYLAYQKDYVWGSNGTKAKHGCIYYNLVFYNIMPEIRQDAISYAERYIHYLHGVNPLNKCYLTNMNQYGAENSVRQIYHCWFENGSDKWDEVGVSKYGPAPGFLCGGPNIEYAWDQCCPNNCGSEYNNSKCFEVDVKPLIGQPAQKSYMDINNGWPINAWSISEVSGGYQVQYLRLLSKFVQ